MTLSEINPLVVYVNLPRREDRRFETEFALKERMISYVRQPGINSIDVRNAWGFKDSRRYACSLAKRLALRRLKFTGHDSVLLLEDDVCFHPNFEELLGRIKLPPDWCLFYLGCRHLLKPIYVGTGIVRCTKATDNHALVVRRSFLNKALHALRGTSRGAPATIDYSDLKLSGIHGSVPAYAAYPNLAWQRSSYSDNSSCHLSFYTPEGNQRMFSSMMEGFAAEHTLEFGAPGARGDGKAPVPARDLGANDGEATVVSSVETKASNKPDLTGDKPSPKPDYSFIMKETKKCSVEEAFPLRMYINLGRRNDRRNKIEEQFRKHSIDINRFPAIDGSFLKQTFGSHRANVRACRASHRLILRHAVRNGAAAVAIFEDDAVLHANFREIVERLPPPEDWGVVFFGCTHLKSPEVISPGWVRANSVWSLHAYAVRDRYYRAIMTALGKASVLSGGVGADVVISGLAGQIPMYAFYPNVAWQDSGFSNLMNMRRAPFTSDGWQNRFTELLGSASTEMSIEIEKIYGAVTNRELRV